MITPIKIQAILDVIEVKAFIGNAIHEIDKIIPLNVNNKDNAALFWCNQKNIEVLAKIKHGTIIIPDAYDQNNLNPNCNYIVVEQPRSVFREVLTAFFVPKNEGAKIEDTAVVSPKSQLSKTVSLEHFVVIEADCVIGENVSIGANTVIKKGTIIGNSVNIGSNCTIGGVGFGYEKDETGAYVQIPHIGNVIIHDHADIGNNTCIDRAVMGSTIIGKNVKVDNLVHIAHGVKIDENSLIIANAMVAGSTEIGKNVWVAPSASIINKTQIGNDAVLGMGAVILKPVDDNAVVVGNPAKRIK